MVRIISLVYIKSKSIRIPMKIIAKGTMSPIQSNIVIIAKI